MTYDNFFKHIGKLRENVYVELPCPHHTAAAREAAEEFLKDLGIQTAVELGAGAAPTLDILKEWGVQTMAVTLQNEPIKYQKHTVHVREHEYMLQVRRA